MFDTIKAWLVAALVFTLVLTLAIRVLAGSAKKPPRSAKQATLPACPDSPNCVSSVCPDGAHFIAPLSFQDAPEEAFSRLKDTLTALGGKQVREEERYLWFEFRTRLLGFTDDLECLLDPESSHIEIRSASRIGHSDLGANRKRVEQIRAAYRPSSASM